MKTLLLILSFLTCLTSLQAQTDTIVDPAAGYVKYLYNPQTHTVNRSYDYSGLWDLDGDGKTDSLFFIGNGGAHTYFFPGIVLSTDGKRRDFPFLQLDMPYISDQKLLQEPGSDVWIQFVPADFDNDGIMDLYLSFDNGFSRVPAGWRKNGIRRKQVILSFPKAKLTVSNP